MANEIDFLLARCMNLPQQDKAAFHMILSESEGEESPAEKFRKKSPTKKPSEKKKKPKKSSKNQVPTKSSTTIDEETMEEETTVTPTDKNPQGSTRTEPETMPTNRRTPPPPTPGKATPMKRPRASSKTPDYSSALKRRLTDEDGFTLVTRKKTPDRTKPTDSTQAEKPKPQKPNRPKHLVAEGTKLDACTSPTEVGRIPQTRNQGKK